MSAVIQFSVFGHKQLERDLVRLATLPKNVAPAWLEIIDQMRKDIEEQFDTEGGSMSGGWAPLKPVTIERKVAQGLRTEIMRATDRLKDSFGEDYSTDQIFKVRPKEFEFGSKVPYGPYHMGPAKDGSRPARKPVDFTEVQRRKYVKILQEYLMGGKG